MILVAGIGNVFLGDDAFGVEVARRLSSRCLPSGVTVDDYGTRGLHLAYALLDPVDLLVVADSTSRGQAAGTLYVIEPENELRVAQSSHGMDLDAVFGMVRALGARPPRVLIVGCEPEDVGERMTLSRTVDRAVDAACDLVLEILERACSPTD